MKLIILFFLNIMYLVSAPSALADISLTKTVYQRASNLTPEKAMKVHFIDVGGGDAILLETPSGKLVVIDAGWSYSDRSQAEPEFEAYINKYIKGRDVDLIIISHPDYDHLAGVPYIISKAKSVKQIWASGYYHNDLSNTWKNLRKKLMRQNKIKFMSPLEDYFELGSVVRLDASGTISKSDDVTVTLVHTLKDISNRAYSSGRSMSESQQRNSASIVVRIDFGANSLLFTGDVNGRPKKDNRPDSLIDDREKFMVEKNNDPNSPLYGLLNVDILKVAHHGLSVVRTFETDYLH